MKYSWLIPVLALCITVIGCNDSTQPKPISITEQPNFTKIGTATNTTDLILRTKIATQSIIVPTKTLTSSPTVAIKPTLNATEIEGVIHELLRTNGDCSLPCFWGIEINETSYQYAEHFFSRLGRKGFTKADKNGIINHYDTSFGVNAGEGYINVEIMLGIKSETITSLDVYIGDFEYVEPSNWQAYSLQNVLQMLGIPSEVKFIIEKPQNTSSDKVSYAYILVYDDPEVVVLYVMGAIADGLTYQICPMNPNNNALYIWLFLGKELSDDYGDWVELTQATTMTHEDFYELFVNGTKDTCMNLNAEAFTNAP